MKALVFSAADADPAVRDFDDPVPTGHEELVDVVAAGIHPVVRKIATGAHYGSTGGYPLIPGVDAVARTPDGALVYTGGPRAPYGTVSERTVVPRGWAMPIPDACDPATVAGTLNPAMAAWLSLVHVGGLVAGQKVLVLGATGTSGRVTMQLAAEFGAQVVAVGRNPDALDDLAKLAGVTTVSLVGSDDEVGSRLGAALAEPPNLVIDYLWGPVAEVVIGVLTRSGLDHHAPRIRWVEVGDSAGAAITLPAAVLRSSGLEFVGSGAGSVDPAVIAAAVPEMLGRIAAGTVSVPVRVVSLDDAAQAWSEPAEPGVRLVVMP